MNMEISDVKARDIICATKHPFPLHMISKLYIKVGAGDRVYLKA